MRVMVLSCVVASGCCPGVYARAKGLPPPIAAALPQARAELILDRTQIGFPPGLDRGARTPERNCSQIGLMLRVQCASVESTAGRPSASARDCFARERTIENAPITPGPLVLKDAADRELQRTNFVERNASGWTTVLRIRDVSGHPLPPGRYQIQVTVTQGEAVAIAREFVEVVSCAFY